MEWIEKKMDGGWDRKKMKKQMDGWMDKKVENN